MPTILELFQNKELLFPGGNTAQGSVKKDSETFIEQETSGIRIKSAVDINNPLIYGNEAMRITKRSTPDVEEMTKNTGGQGTDGGLIGKGLDKLTGGKIKSIGDIRDKVNNVLGIPTNAIPTRLIGKEEFKGLKSTDPVTLDVYGKNGTDFGKFLKQTGGGNPKTIGKQALGKGLGVAKDILRGALFGEGAQEASNQANLNYAVESTDNENTYSKANNSKRLKSDKPLEDLEKNTKLGINLNTVSPIYGINRKEGDRRNRFQGTNSLGFSRYDATSKDKTYSGIEPYTKANGPKNQMLNKYKLGTGDGINTVSPVDDYTIDENAFIKVGDTVYKDFIPLWFKRMGAEKPLVFRAIVSGITETTTPSWSGNKFIGNPYSFYMYEGVERSLAFNVKLFASSPVELNIIWERLKILTSYTYPVIKGGVTNPPIVTFRMGDMYVDRESFVDSLTYTIPDESNWETNGKVGYLPKMVDVAMSMKFIESPGSEERLYDMEISKEAVKQINEDRKADKDAIDEETRTRGGQVVKEDPVKMTAKRKSSVTVLKGKGSSALGDAKKKLKSLKSKAKASVPSVPSDIAEGIPNKQGGQSAVADKFDGKTPLVASKETQAKHQLTEEQSKKITFQKVLHPDVKVIPKSQVPSNYIILGKSPDDPWPHSPGDVYITYKSNPGETHEKVEYAGIDSTGYTHHMMTTKELDDMIAETPSLANWKK